MYTCQTCPALASGRGHLGIPDVWNITSAKLGMCLKSFRLCAESHRGKTTPALSHLKLYHKVINADEQDLFQRHSVSHQNDVQITISGDLLLSHKEMHLQVNKHRTDNWIPHYKHNVKSQPISVSVTFFPFFASEQSIEEKGTESDEQTGCWRWIQPHYGERIQPRSQSGSEGTASSFQVNKRWPLGGLGMTSAIGTYMKQESQPFYCEETEETFEKGVERERARERERKGGRERGMGRGLERKSLKGAGKAMELWRLGPNQKRFAKPKRFPVLFHWGFLQLLPSSLPLFSQLLSILFQGGLSAIMAPAFFLSLSSDIKFSSGQKKKKEKKKLRPIPERSEHQVTLKQHTVCLCMVCVCLCVVCGVYVCVCVHQSGLSLQLTTFHLGQCRIYLSKGAVKWPYLQQSGNYNVCIQNR